ncbi:hypothetical protein Aduo_015073 [Ancylostoma duodenale]
MSKAGAVGRGLYAVLAFLVNALLRIGINLSLVAAVVVTVYAVGTFSKEALKQRKEGTCCQKVFICVHSVSECCAWLLLALWTYLS